MAPMPALFFFFFAWRDAPLTFSLCSPASQYSLIFYIHQGEFDPAKTPTCLCLSESLPPAPPLPYLPIYTATSTPTSPRCMPFLFPLAPHPPRFSLEASSRKITIAFPQFLPSSSCSFLLSCDSPFFSFSPLFFCQNCFPLGTLSGASPSFSIGRRPPFPDLIKSHLNDQTACHPTYPFAPNTPTQSQKRFWRLLTVTRPIFSFLCGPFRLNGQALRLHTFLSCVSLFSASPIRISFVFSFFFSLSSPCPTPRIQHAFLSYFFFVFSFMVLYPKFWRGGNSQGPCPLKPPSAKRRLIETTYLLSFLFITCYPVVFLLIFVLFRESCFPGPFGSELVGLWCPFFPLSFATPIETPQYHLHSLYFVVFFSWLL